MSTNAGCVYPEQVQAYVGPGICCCAVVKLLLREHSETFRVRGMSAAVAAAHHRGCCFPSSQSTRLILSSPGAILSNTAALLSYWLEQAGVDVSTITMNQSCFVSSGRRFGNLLRCDRACKFKVTPKRMMRRVATQKQISDVRFC